MTSFMSNEHPFCNVFGPDRLFLGFDLFLSPGFDLFLVFLLLAAGLALQVILVQPVLSLWC